VATRRLFDEDSHLCAFEARVLEVREDPASPGGAWVALDATAFFPEEGGQLADRGELAGIAVTGLSMDEAGVIWHRLAHSPPWIPGFAVAGRIDAASRRDHRQQHSGQHILSRIFTERIGAATRSFHMGEELSTVDIDDGGRLELSNLREVEDRANAVVMDDLPVTVIEEGRAGGRPLRTVAIEGIESQHCCGTHVKRTGEVGLIKVLRWEKIRGLTRVHFVCGGRALRLFQRTIESIDGAARPLSAGWFDLPRAVAGLLEEGRESERRARTWQRRWAGLETERLAAGTPRGGDGLLRVAAWIEGADAETLRAASRQILERGDAIVLLAGTGVPGKRPWVAGRTETLPAGHLFDARETLDRIFGSIGGRGGGSAQFAQGASPAEEEVCREALRREIGA
jgi:alanyl-tRNA synthetase